MKIISNFKDYYDGVAHNDYEKDQYKYIRERIPILRYFKSGPYSRAIKNIAAPFSGFRYIYRDGGSVDPSFHLLGYCGKLYPYLALHYSNHRALYPLLQGTGKERFYFYSFEEFQELIEKIGKPASKYFDSHNSLKKYVNSWNEVCKRAESTDIQGMFLEFGVPLFEISNPDRNDAVLTLNPVLSDLGFQKIKDPYTAYQDIDTFVSNDLVRIDNPADNFSDELKIHAHGFDKKSFRKAPTKRKKR